VSDPSAVYYRVKSSTRPTSYYLTMRAVPPYSDLDPSPQEMNR